MSHISFVPWRISWAIIQTNTRTHAPTECMANSQARSSCFCIRCLSSICSHEYDWHIKSHLTTQIIFVSHIFQFEWTSLIIFRISFIWYFINGIIVCLCVWHHAVCIIHWNKKIVQWIQFTLHIIISTLIVVEPTFLVRFFFLSFFLSVVLVMVLLLSSSSSELSSSPSDYVTEQINAIVTFWKMLCVHNV